MALRFPRWSGRAAPDAGETDPTRGDRAADDGLDESSESAERAPTPPRSPFPEGAVPTPPVVVPRWIQLVVLPLALLALWALARAAGTVLLVLLAASTVALVLNPLVKRLVRRGLPRGLAILVLYVGVFAFVGGLGVVLANPVSTQVSRLERDVPQYVSPGQPQPGQPAALAGRPRHQRADSAAGTDRAPDPPAQHPQALERHRVVLPRPAHARSSPPGSTSS